MNTAKLLLQILKEYEVKHVFGLPGETTIPWYVEWQSFSEIAHVLARDERSAAYMADAYARVSFKPGICEGPSVGATHLVPGVAEAYKASVPMIVFTTDIPLHYEKRNMLTGIDQTLLFKGVTKETITVVKGSEISQILRRAFRLATTGRQGPVHVRLPSNILEEDIESPIIHVQKDFRNYPGHRPTAETGKIGEAMRLLSAAERPVIICGQGVLYSKAWEEIVELAELFGIPVGTTISGKGSIAETHSLSIGVIGSRGGTSFSNRIVREADLIFYIGCNTDSSGTANWTLPPLTSDTKIIHLDISEAEPGNNYNTNVVLIGDAKATLEKMMAITRVKMKGWKYSDFNELPRIKKILKTAKEYNEYTKELEKSDEKPVHPLRFIRILSKEIPKDHILVADPGVGAIYTSAFYKVKKAGRSIIYNYALGALGYAIPATVGIHYARPKSCVVALTGDGSFGFAVGELETISRVGGNINIIVFNNGCYGWIKAELQLAYGSKHVDFATNFNQIDYQRIAEGFGLKTYIISEPKEVPIVLRRAFNLDEPTLIDFKVKPENELVPPVPSWAKKAQELGIRYVY